MTAAEAALKPLADAVEKANKALFLAKKMTTLATAASKKAVEAEKAAVTALAAAKLLKTTLEQEQAAASAEFRTVAMSIILCSTCTEQETTVATKKADDANKLLKAKEAALVTATADLAKAEKLVTTTAQDVKIKAAAASAATKAAATKAEEALSAVKLSEAQGLKQQETQRICKANQYKAVQSNAK